MGDGGEVRYDDGIGFCLGRQVLGFPLGPVGRFCSLSIVTYPGSQRASAYPCDISNRNRKRNSLANFTLVNSRRRRLHVLAGLYKLWSLGPGLHVCERL